MLSRLARRGRTAPPTRPEQSHWPLFTPSWLLVPASWRTVPVMVFWQLTIDANDPARLARFWAQALGYQAAPPTEPKAAWWRHYQSRLGARAAFDDRLFDPQGLRPPIWFRQVPEGKRRS